MNCLFKWLTIILALCLPWHGAITVFLPDYFRYWKEIVLFLYFAGFCWKYIQDKKYKLPLFTNKALPSFYAILFLVCGALLVLFSEDKITALLAFRYLGMGIAVYLLFSLISQNFAGFKEGFNKYFRKIFIFSNIASVLFGIWIKFSSGVNIVENFYSKTISSWVPGQTIPIWHESGYFIRMQGASSGPIEFSHLLFIALFLTLTSKLKDIYKILFSSVLLFGIYQSYSRAAVLGAIILLLFVLFKHLNFAIKKNKKEILMSIIMVFFAGFWGLTNTNILERTGTSDHFKRPIESTKFAIKNVFSNNLGKLGPAARKKNLREKNDDKAMIAENVFIDIFAQMGILGISFYLLFIFSLLKNIKPEYYGFIFAFFLLMNMATIFDMTPVSITFFSVLFIIISNKELIE